MTARTPELVVVAGPTAAGKSAFALQLAEQCGGEIISADSRHIYRRMDIGTNKPTPAERTRVPHHLLDLREPHESFSLGEYVALARAAIDEIIRHGRVPILVGGTGQYVRALLRNWQVPPVPPNPELRQRWQAFAASHGTTALFEVLRSRDPTAAERIDPRNLRRVIRALEVIELTGQRWSDLQQAAPPALPVRMFYICPSREALYARADARIDHMLAQGWLDEVARLLDEFADRGIAGDAALTLPAMSALGYRELAQAVTGQISLEEAVARIRQATRRFIRMQDVWFRRDAQLFGAQIVPTLQG